MVFEHVPQFWRAIRVLLRITKPKGQAHEFALNLACPSHLHSDLGAEIILTPRPGYIVWATPFYYRYHPIPGDFWRFTYQGNIYLLESNDFDVRPCDCNHLITRSTSQSDVATTVYAAQKVSACVRTRGSTCTGRCSSPNQWECRSAVCGDLAECTTKPWSRTATSAAPHSDGVRRSSIQPWKALSEAHPSGAEPYVVDGRGKREARRSDRVLGRCALLEVEASSRKLLLRSRSYSSGFVA
jgi:hypothetical protein